MKKFNEMLFYFLCAICVLAAINAFGFIFPDDLTAKSSGTGFFWSALVSIASGVSAKLMYNKHKFEPEDESPEFSDLENTEKK